MIILKMQSNYILKQPIKKAIRQLADGF